MHIPAYARATIRAALPTLPTSRHVGAVDCCLCDEPFGDRAVVPLGPTPESGLFGCRPCLTRLVTQARKARDSALVRDAERARAESAEWEPARARHLARLDRVREAAEAVAELARDEDTAALRVAWLLVSLESAYTWLPEAPEPPPSVGGEAPELKDGAFRLDLAMISAREAVAERLAYHLLNEAQGDEPEMCEEFGCPADCSGQHDSSHIDCGPDAVFDDLAEHGVALEKPEPEPLGPALRALLERTSAAPEASGARSEASGPGAGWTPESSGPGAGRAPASSGSWGSGAGPTSTESEGRLAELVEGCEAILAHFAVSADDPEILLSAAAVGLVHDAWREGPLDEIHAREDGPSDGEIVAQGVDLYRRARAALLAARASGPEALSAFVAVASDVRLRWAGGSGFLLRHAAAGPDDESLAEFVRHVESRVWFTGEVMRARGWRGALLHRAASAAFKAPGHFGMPAWPAVVDAAVRRLAGMDRSGAPEGLADLDAVERALREAPDRLGVAALDWLARRGLLDAPEVTA
ncbi:hypothetical protein [Streptomyces sp. NPDC059071]|uniref:hypothetical protein n=1 Tax=unclassified Streptomyces TaxID=2593676 RepID=UPI003649DDE9